jgi:DNA modification methylase
MVRRVYSSDYVELHEGDCLQWLSTQPPNSIQAVVTDPPYGLLEYSPEQQAKLRAGRGGVWRIPPSIGGSKRAPLPRFTVLNGSHLSELYDFFARWAESLYPVLVPGAHLFIASSPLLSYAVSQALCNHGYEKRGEIVRLVRTLRGGDRPKGAETEFHEVSAMPRSCWEPWVIFRKPMAGTLSENLRRWQAGGLRRPNGHQPFPDVIESSRTPRAERLVAPHPSLKPQRFLRQIVHAALPLGLGTVLDPFAGSGSTLAACEAIGYRGIGIEMDPTYAEMAARAIPALAGMYREAGQARARREAAYAGSK